MKTIALINPRAGSVGPTGARRMHKALAKVGLDHADIRELDLLDSRAQLESIQRKAPDLVIVWGGDGTHRSALEVLGQHSSQLLLLPGGTMNLPPKWLHGEQPWETVLWSVLGAPTPRVLPAGKVGDSLLFCALLAGIPRSAFRSARGCPAGRFRESD